MSSRPPVLSHYWTRKEILQALQHFLIARPVHQQRAPMELVDDVRVEILPVALRRQVRQKIGPHFSQLWVVDAHLEDLEMKAPVVCLGRALQFQVVLHE
jgi:hypothetical protein